MPRGKPGQWAELIARPIQRVQRDRIAEELVEELRELKRLRDEAVDVEEADALSVSRKTGDTIMMGSLDLESGTITVTDCQIRRQKVVAPLSDA